MKLGIRWFILNLTLVLWLFAPTTMAQIRLPALISDGMVLQRDADLKIWGWASPNEKIKLSLDKEVFKTKADARGLKKSFPPPLFKLL